MPQADNECVVDALFAADNVLGKTITMTDNNEADTLGMFTYKTYRVVGLVNSPLYINFSRGTTTLGNGTVKGFVYVLPAAFDVDYYTEAYVRLEKTGGVYTDEYAAAINAFRDTMRQLVVYRMGAGMPSNSFCWFCQAVPKFPLSWGYFFSSG